MKTQNFLLKMLALAIMPFQVKHQADSGVSNAVIKLGAFMTDLRGKVGGTIFSKNKGGAYAKNRVIPNNPKTTAQTSVRGVFGYLSSNWRVLTESSRDAWRGLATQLSFQNKVGDAINISGLALYQKFNGNLNTIGRAPIIVPQPLEGTTAIALNGVVVSVDVDQVGINLDAQELTVPVAGTQYAVFATPPLSAGINNFDKYLRLVSVANTFADLEIADTLGDAYELKFGRPTIGSNVGIKVLPVNSNTGESGVATTISAFATEA